MTERCPGLRFMARENRHFILNAAEWVARREVRQFLDLGCGRPPRPAVHDAARSVIPDASVVYVDRDPVVILSAAALDRGSGLAALEADVRDVGGVLDSAEVREVVDLSEPVCVIFGGTLSDMPLMSARRTVAGYAEALVPGSAIVISCAHFDDQELAVRLAEMSSPSGVWRNRSRADVASLFAAAKVEPLRGEVADVRCWPMGSSGNGREACMLGGVGIKE